MNATAAQRHRAGLAIALCLCVSAAMFAVPAEKQFRPALPGYHFEFPRDHFSHPDFKTEWWYYTGHLSAPDGARFGFELTFFREGVANEYANPSRWRLDNLYFAHFAVTNTGQESFRYTQRMQRGALGLAGATPAGSLLPEARVWVGDWSTTIGPDSQRVRAAGSDFAVQLELRPLKPPVIHGQDGVTLKGLEFGETSHYYSYTRLQTAGTLRFENRSYAVTGLSWMDHEFFTTPHPARTYGWDWFGLQFDDGSELMLYQVRPAGAPRGIGSPLLVGTYIPPSGPARSLAKNDLTLAARPEAGWTSPQGGARYPLQWQIKVPFLELELDVRPELLDQELVTNATSGVTYWEGAVYAIGQKQGARILANGYMELTGYASRAAETRP